MIGTLTRGDIVLVRTPGIFGALIRGVESYQDGTPADWNHAAIYIGNGLIIEALPHAGIVVSRLDKYKVPGCRYAIYHRRDIPQNSSFRDGEDNGLASQVVIAAMEMEGTRYSYWSILLHLGDAILQARLGIRCRPLAQCLGTPLRMLCSEMVARAWRRADLSQTFSGRTIGASPDDIGDEVQGDRWECVADVLTA